MPYASCFTFMSQLPINNYRSCKEQRSLMLPLVVPKTVEQNTQDLWSHIPVDCLLNIIFTLSRNFCYEEVSNSRPNDSVEFKHLTSKLMFIKNFTSVSHNVCRISQINKYTRDIFRKKRILIWQSHISQNFATPLSMSNMLIDNDNDFESQTKMFVLIKKNLDRLARAFDRCEYSDISTELNNLCGPNGRFDVVHNRDYEYGWSISLFFCSEELRMCTVKFLNVKFDEKLVKEWQMAIDEQDQNKSLFPLRLTNDQTNILLDCSNPFVVGKRLEILRFCQENIARKASEAASAARVAAPAAAPVVAPTVVANVGRPWGEYCSVF